MDNTVISPQSTGLEYLNDLYVFKGRPQNLDEEHEVVNLVNHGYTVGFSPHRMQPIWAAYRVAGSDRDVDYDRPHLYYDDARLPEDQRIGANTFGKKDNIQYHVGHMVPNQATNRQFGRLAQMETFFMSNMSPQRGYLNTGIWKRLEDSIRNIEDTGSRDHVWAIVGPIFAEDPDDIEYIDRPNGTRVPIPESYFCITVDPYRYPYDRLSNVEILCLIIPQDAGSGDSFEDYTVSLEEIEQKTKLKFFPQWVDAGVLPTGDAAQPGADVFADTLTHHRLANKIM